MQNKLFLFIMLMKLIKSYEIHTQVHSGNVISYNLESTENYDEINENDENLDIDNKIPEETKLENEGVSTDIYENSNIENNKIHPIILVENDERPNFDLEPTEYQLKVRQVLIRIGEYYDAIFSYLKSTFHNLFQNDGDRTFGLIGKRIQMTFIPLFYKVGVIGTMVAFLILISLKGLSITVFLLVLGLSAFLAKFQSFGTAPTPQNIAYQPPYQAPFNPLKQIHVHIHNPPPADYNYQNYKHSTPYNYIDYSPQPKYGLPPSHEFSRADWSYDPYFSEEFSNLINSKSLSPFDVDYSSRQLEPTVKSIFKGFEEKKDLIPSKTAKVVVYSYSIPYDETLQKLLYSNLIENKNSNLIQNKNQIDPRLSTNSNNFNQFSNNSI